MRKLLVNLLLLVLLSCVVVALDFDVNERINYLQRTKIACERSSDSARCIQFANIRIDCLKNTTDFDKIKRACELENKRINSYNILMSQELFKDFENFTRRIPNSVKKDNSYDDDLEFAKEAYFESLELIKELQPDYEDCEGECEELNKEFKKTLRTFLVKTTEIQLAKLNILKQDIENSKYVSNDDVKRFNDDIDKKIRSISNLKTQIAGLSTEGPISEYVSSSKLVNSKLKTVRIAIRKYGGRLVNAKISSTILRGKYINSILSRFIVFAAEKQENLPTLEVLSEEYDQLLDESLAYNLKADEFFKDGKSKSAQKELFKSHNSLVLASNVLVDIFVNLEDHDMMFEFNILKNTPLPSPKDIYVPPKKVIVNVSLNKNLTNSSEDKNDDDSDENEDKYVISDLEQAKLAATRSKRKAELALDDLDEEIDDSKDDYDDMTNGTRRDRLYDNLNDAKSEQDDAEDAYDEGIFKMRFARSTDDYRTIEDHFKRSITFAKNGLEVLE